MTRIRVLSLAEENKQRSVTSCLQTACHLLGAPGTQWIRKHPREHIAGTKDQDDNKHRERATEEVSYSTAASSENKGLDKMVSKDPCGSNTSKHEIRARVRMQVIGST